MRAPVTQPLRYSVLSTLGDRYPVPLGARCADQFARAAPAIRAPQSSRAALRAANPDDRRFIAAVLQVVPRRVVLLHARAAAARGGSGRRVPVRFAARLLRALRERVRRHAARRRHSRARGDRLPGRRDQSARRLHDRAPIRRARMGGSDRRRPMAAVRPDGRRCAVARRARTVRRRGRERARAAVRAPGRRLAQGRCSLPSTRSITNGAATSIQFNRDRQRALWREWKLDQFAPWQVAVAASVGAARLGRRRIRMVRGAAQAPGARVDAVERRLPPARARGNAALQLRRADRVRRTRGVTLAAVRHRVSRDRRIVRGAALWNASGATASGSR